MRVEAGGVAVAALLKDMATETPRRVENREAERLEGLPGSAPAGATAANGEEVEATARLLEGCVPLSHQVAGHMFGKDKGGEWRAKAGGGGEAKV